MPELPDLVAMERYVKSTALHQRVLSVDVGRTYVLHDLPPERLVRALKGHRFEGVRRHGKNLLVETDGGPWLRLHFGMTGNLSYFKHHDEKPEHTRVLFSFETGYHLAYVCQRMLGRVSLEDGPDEFVRKEDLGPDALGVGWADFRDIMEGRRGMLKSTLMNQSIIAGLGNVYADETLFQAHLHPETTIDQLSPDRLEELYHAMRDVLNTAIQRGSDARELPETYLVHRRGEGAPCPRCSSSIARVKINQRSTYFCPRCQPSRETQ